MADDKDKGGAKATGKKEAKLDRTAVKSRLKGLKKTREEAKEGKDATKLARIRRQYRRATHTLRKAAPAKGKKAKKE